MDSTDKIVIYGHQASRASRPYWLLREYGMTINEDFIEVDTGGPVTGFNEVRETDEFLALNPYGLIPVMKHKDLVLYECQAICQYIADLLGGPLAAQDASERARISMYGLSSIANFEPNFLPMVFGQGGEEGRAQFTANLQPLLGALDRELEGREYLIGDGAELVAPFLAGGAHRELEISSALNLLGDGLTHIAAAHKAQAHCRFELPLRP